MFQRLAAEQATAEVLFVCLFKGTAGGAKRTEARRQAWEKGSTTNLFMKKGVKLTAAALLLASGAMAQAPVDTLNVDNSDFTFTESQLDEDNDAAQTVSNITGQKSDPYNSEVGYLFSPMRFRTRGYDGMYSNYYMNGLQLNDLEMGRFSYSMVGGMNDATRNQEGVLSNDFNRFGIAGIGGGTNVNTRASQFASGNKITLSGCNRNYVARGMYSYATGLNSKGWAFAGLVGYRWANQGNIEGTFYNSLSYFLSVEKRIGDNHALSLVTFGSPTERGQQGASTEEAYWLANSHYYNPNWGYQNGKKRNSRVVNDYEPTAILTWDWKIADNMKLTTAGGFKYSMYSSTALGWNGNAYDPRPDYYKNLPSSAYDVYDGTMPSAWEQQEWNVMYDAWQNKAHRQIDWDRMYAVNRAAAAQGDETLYYQERRHNNQMVETFNTIFNHEINHKQKYAIGFQYNHTKGMHYKTMADLLGGTTYTDIDKFSANDYGQNSQEAQNDLNNPNRQIGVGDKFGYNYNIFVNKSRLYGMYQYTEGKWQYNLQAFADETMMEREGLMRNGRAADNSYGRSGKANFLGGGGRFGLTFRPTASHVVALNLGAESAAPLARNSFVAPRMQNDFVNNLTNEQIFNADLSYTFRFGNFSGKVAGYYTRFNSGVEQTAFYNDDESRFTYLTMTGVDREHYGVEAAFNYQVTSNLSVKLVGTYGEAKYVNNPLAQMAYEGSNAATIADINVWQNPNTKKSMPLSVLAKNAHVSGSPLAAVSLGVDYNVNGWFFSANLNYYDRVYIDFSEYRRLSNINTYVRTATTTVNENGEKTVQYQYYKCDKTGTFSNTSDTSTPQEIKDGGGGVVFADGGNGSIVETIYAEQEKAKGGFMLDLSIGKYIRLKKGKSLSINLTVQNVTNNRNLKTGGYEQNRSDFYNTGTKRSYNFSRNSKYYYANAINGFLNIGFKF